MSGQLTRRGLLRTAAALAASTISPIAVSAPSVVPWILPPRAFDKYVHGIEASPQDSMRLYEAYYRRTLRPQYAMDGLSGAADSELIAAFDAIYLVVFYTAALEPLAHMAQVFDLMRKRGLSTPQQLQKTYDAAYFCRDVARCAALATRYPDQLKRSPPIRLSHGAHVAAPTIMHMVSGESDLFATRYVMPEGPSVIMIAHPLCHFSRNAIDALRREWRVLARFHERLTLITPHEINPNIEHIRRWNTHVPDFYMAMAYHWRGWKDFDMRDTPKFYFLVDGAVRHATSGWPKEGNLQDLEAGLRVIGL